MLKNTPFTRALLATALVCTLTRWAGAHGFVGDRFFPPTIATDDPFATDELSLPTITYGPDDGTPSFNTAFEFDKEILPKFAIGVSDSFNLTKPPGSPQWKQWQAGWDDVELSAKYQLWQNDDHEAILSAGLVTDLGDTGTVSRGADAFTTLTPTLYWGKGLGDLPDSLSLLRPLAFTGTLGQSFPFKNDDPNQFQWGVAVEYSLPYMNTNVTEVPPILKNLIPLIEFNMTTNENRPGEAGLTTGTINPGVLWESPDVQVGLEAVIPVNDLSGTNIGATLNVQIFIDDLWPTIFGHPLFGGN